MTSVIVAAVLTAKFAMAVGLTDSIKDKQKKVAGVVSEKADTTSKGADTVSKKSAAMAGKTVNTGDAATQVALDALTKKLKSVQKDEGPILFKKGGAVIDPKCDKTMKRVKEIIAEYPGFHVQVDGHTDNVGKPASNLKLSQKRADAVISYLVSKHKVDKTRLSAKGWGDAQPIADNKTKEGQAQNRRVDFTVTK